MPRQQNLARPEAGTERRVARRPRGGLEADPGREIHAYANAVEGHVERRAHLGAVARPIGRAGLKVMVDVQRAQTIAIDHARGRRQKHRGIEAAAEGDDEVRGGFGVFQGAPKPFEESTLGRISLP